MKYVLIFAWCIATPDAERCGTRSADMYFSTEAACDFAGARAQAVHTARVTTSDNRLLTSAVYCMPVPNEEAL